MWNSGEKFAIKGANWYFRRIRHDFKVGQTTTYLNLTLQSVKYSIWDVTDYEYNSGNSPLGISQVERDLEVLVPYEVFCDRNDFWTNLALVTSKCIFGLFGLVFNSFIRLHLEYWNIVFPPSPQTDRDTLRCIQIRTTKSFQDSNSSPMKRSYNLKF